MASLKVALGAHELKDKKAGLFRALLAELLGTLLLNFFGCGAVESGNVVAVSLAFGLTVAAAIQAIGHVSGGHVNPAVTVGLAVVGKIPIIRALLYIVAQCTGAIVGSAILRAVSFIPKEITDEDLMSKLGAVALNDNLLPVQGLGIEFFLALILVLVVCGATDGAKPESKGIAPLLIGLAVTVSHIVGVPRTGSGMNPARALGSSVAVGNFTNHWIYWVGPVLGGMAGALIYTHAIGPAKEPEQPKSYNPVATEEKEIIKHKREGLDHSESSFCCVQEEPAETQERATDALSRLVTLFVAVFMVLSNGRRLAIAN